MVGMQSIEFHSTIAVKIKDNLLEIRPVTQSNLEAVLEVYRQCEDFLSLGPVGAALSVNPNCIQIRQLPLICERTLKQRQHPEIFAVTRKRLTSPAHGLLTCAILLLVYRQN